MNFYNNFHKRPPSKCKTVVRNPTNAIAIRISAQSPFLPYSNRFDELALISVLNYVQWHQQVQHYLTAQYTSLRLLTDGIMFLEEPR